MSEPLRFGLFHPPFHAPGENPTLTFEHDLQLVEHADMLGFDEFWFGEQDCGGFELSGCPEAGRSSARCTSRPRARRHREEVRHGLLDRYAYCSTAAGPHTPVAATDDLDDLDDAIEQMIASGIGVIGARGDALAQIERLLGRSGGFGTYLTMIHEWADRPATLRSIELIARHVVPHFPGQLERQAEWFEWFRAHRDEIHQDFDAAQAKALDDHVAQRTAAVRPPLGGLRDL